MAVTAPSVLLYDFAATTNSHSVTLDPSCNFLVVFVATRFTPTTISPITYGGNALTDQSNIQNAGSTVYMDIFTLQSPPTGTNTLAITLGTSRLCMVAAFGCAGVDGTTPLRNQSGVNYGRSALNPGTAPSFTLAGQTNDLAIDMVQVPAETDNTLTVGSGQTEAYTQLRDNSSTNYMRVGGSTRPGSTSATMSWTAANSGAIQSMGVMVAAATVTGGTAATRAALTGYGVL